MGIQAQIAFASTASIFKLNRGQVSGGPNDSSVGLVFKPYLSNCYVVQKLCPIWHFAENNTAIDAVLHQGDFC
jgi:hypothetical protein